jgi:hypothetical protein
MQDTGGPRAGSVFAPFITMQLDQERARKTAIESRALNLVTSAGVFVGLFTGLITLVKGKDYQLQSETLVVLGVAYLLLFAAAAIGIYVNFSGNTVGSYAEISMALLAKWLEQWSSGDPAAAGLTVAKDQMGTLRFARATNTRKVKWIAVGAGAEVAAAALMVLAVGLTILHR